MSDHSLSDDYAAVLAATSLTEYLKGHRCQVQKGSITSLAECPFCYDGLNMRIDEVTQEASCDSCGRAGNAIDLETALTGDPRLECLERLADQAHIHLTGERYSDSIDRQVAVLEAARDFYYSNVSNEKSSEYLKQRGIKDKTITEFRIGYAPAGWSNLRDHLRSKGFSLEEMLAQGLIIENKAGTSYFDRFRDRVMIPLLDHKGLILGFAGRDLSGDDQQAKYMTSSETEGGLFNKKGILFGLSRLASRRSVRRLKSVYVTEGQFDLMTAVQAGIDNIVCPLGTNFNYYHARQLKRHASEVVFVFDNDEAGIKAARNRARIAYEVGLTPKYILLPKGTEKVDLDLFLRNSPDPKKDFESLRQLSFVEFFIETDTRDKTQPDSRLGIIDDVLSVIDCESNLARRMDWVQYLGKTLGIPEVVEQRFRERITQRPQLPSSRTSLIWDYLANLRYLPKEVARAEADDIPIDSSFFTPDQEVIYEALLEQQQPQVQGHLFEEHVDPLQFLMDLYQEGRISNLDPYFVRVLRSKPRRGLISCKKGLATLVKTDKFNFLIEQIRFAKKCLEDHKREGRTEKIPAAEVNLARLAAQFDGFLLESNGMH